MNYQCRVRLNDSSSVELRAILVGFMPSVNPKESYQEFRIGESENLLPFQSCDAIVVLREMQEGKLIQVPLRLVSDFEPFGA